MIIHNIEECEKWLCRTQQYGVLEKIYQFCPEIDDMRCLNWHIVDICEKGFQHSIERIKIDVDIICDNFPKLKKIVDDLHIFMCPKPSVDTANACASTRYICYFARSTQIPWCMTDYITGHELGHIVDYHFCNTGRQRPKYEEYRTLRCINETFNESRWDKSVFELFAEDFRYLFGVDQGDKFWGLPIAPPNEKIKDFILSL